MEPHAATSLASCSCTADSHAQPRSDALAECIQRLAQRGLLHVEEPQLAAYHFAYLVLTIPLDRAMLSGEDVMHTFTPGELEHFADAAVRVFLAAYG